MCTHNIFLYQQFREFISNVRSLKTTGPEIFCQTTVESSIFVSQTNDPRHLVIHYCALQSSVNAIEMDPISNSYINKYDTYFLNGYYDASFNRK